MAKTKSTKKKKAPAPKKSAPAPKKRTENAVPPAPVGEPHRREIAGGVFLFLAVVMGIGYFVREGAVVDYAFGFFSGLLGWGVYTLAPVFLIAALALFFHKGKPVAFRVFSLLLLPILFSALAHLSYADPLKDGFEIKSAVESFFESGRGLVSGGVLGGLISVGCESAFSHIGGFLILLALFFVFLVIGLRLNLNSMAGKLKERATMPYPVEPEPEPEPVPAESRRPVKAAAPDLEPAWSKPSRQRQRVEEARINNYANNYSDIDVPLGEDEKPLPLGRFEEPEDELFQSSSRRTKVRKKAASATEPTAHVKPVSETEAAAIAGVDVGEGFIEYKMDGKKPGRVPLTAEINDPPKRKISKEDVAAEAKAVADAVAAAGDAGAVYRFPPLELLRSGAGSAAPDARDEIRVNRQRLEEAIRSFGIDAGVVDVTRGPTVTRYDIELEKGVKLARVTNLAGDLALALGVANVRIAPIPDKIATVGIEVPNRQVSPVCLRDILESQKFIAARSKLSFALGKDIGGDAVIGDISKLPHLLIAGTTGSGKSVCMNSLILSLLYKARPDEVKLIMIDPKMVELGIYNGIPHLYVPVVTDPKKAAGALQWAVVEMLKRYRLFSDAGVRDVAGYNKHCAASGDAPLPQVVVVIDELADLMMIAAKEVEESICRVAQMGRAAGMHLVVATQRPSADIITGLMKANIPSRIAFAVSGALDSRIILDQAGAEKLVGRGDMLFAPLGSNKPTRIQGAFVSDEEREAVVQFIKESAGAVAQNSEIEEYMNKAAEAKAAPAENETESGPAGDYDEMLPQAVEAVLEAGSCSVSMLQRRVKLGYSRAARIVDQMEELGVVGPYEGAKPRAVVIDRNGWHELQVQLGLAKDDDLALAREMSEESEE